MATTSPPSERLITLDVIRGLAVMGIFSVNCVGLAMLQFAYFYPPAYGFEGVGDHIMWFLNFLFVDGKLRSLFSMLFGASMLLVFERAVAAGRSGWRTHYARMAVLLVIGWLHWALLWWGDILTHYAAVGMVVVLLWKLRAKWLLVIASVAFILNAAAPAYFFTKEIAEYRQVQRGEASAEVTKKWDERLKDLKPSDERLAEDRADHRDVTTRFNAALGDVKAPIDGEDVFEVLGPLDLGPLWLETMALMLLGMAGYKSGFLTGTWSDRSYRKVAGIGLGLGLAAYAFFGIRAWMAGFAPAEMFGATQAGDADLPADHGVGLCGAVHPPVPQALGDPRPLRRGRPHRVQQLSAVHDHRHLDLLRLRPRPLRRPVARRGWLLVPPVWAAMLLWSKPWLDRFNYGPLEWLWRSLSRGKLQPMRKRAAAEAATVGA